MRQWVFAGAVAVLGLLSLTAGAAFAEAQAPQQLVLNNYKAPEGDKLLKALNPKSWIQTAQFCGQCSSDDACGSGHKCCAMKGCPASASKGCFAVTTCP